MQQRAKALRGRFFSAFRCIVQLLTSVPQVQSLNRNCHCLTKTAFCIKKHLFTFSAVFFSNISHISQSHCQYPTLPTKTVNRTLPVEMMLLRSLALLPVSSASECSDQILPQRKSRVKGLGYSEPSLGVRLQEDQGVLG